MWVGTKFSMVAEGLLQPSKICIAAIMVTENLLQPLKYGNRCGNRNRIPAFFTHPLPRMQSTRGYGQYVGGRYASYWNAYLFGNIFAENCINMKEIGPCRRTRAPPLSDPPSSRMKVIFLTGVMTRLKSLVCYKLFLDQISISYPVFCTAFLWSTLLT